MVYNEKNFNLGKESILCSLESSINVPGFATSENLLPSVADEDKDTGGVWDVVGWDDSIVKDKEGIPISCFRKLVRDVHKVLKYLGLGRVALQQFPLFVNGLVDAIPRIINHYFIIYCLLPTIFVIIIYYQ
jgi:hypothetical protein